MVDFVTNVEVIVDSLALSYEANMVRCSVFAEEHLEVVLVRVRVEDARNGVSVPVGGFWDVLIRNLCKFVQSFQR